MEGQPQRPAAPITRSPVTPSRPVGPNTGEAELQQEQGVARDLTGATGMRNRYSPPSVSASPSMGGIFQADLVQPLQSQH